MNNLRITIHLSGEPMCPPGRAHLLAAPSDFRELLDFFSKHFEVAEFATGDSGARYHVKYVPITDEGDDE